MMKKDQFVYVTYIRTTSEKLWKALTEPDFTRKFWCNTAQESEWKPGSSWKIMAPDGMLTDSGEVLEIEPPRRHVLKWRNEFRPELKAEGYSRLTYELEPEGKSVKLTVIHEIEKEGSKFIEAVSNGWPHILASLKSFLETGESLEEIREWRVKRVSETFGKIPKEFYHSARPWADESAAVDLSGSWITSPNGVARIQGCS